MKSILKLFTLFIFICCKAQVLPLENIIPVEDYFDYSTDVPDGAYIKDINNLFDKYIGTWVGVHDGKNYELVVIGYTESYLGITEDKLIIKYKITDLSGNILANTLDVSDNDLSVITGDYLDENGETYHLDYMGENFVCGQNGYILIAVVDGGLKMNFSYSIRGETTSACTTGPAQQVFPSTLQLDKQ